MLANENVKMIHATVGEWQSEVHVHVSPTTFTASANFSQGRRRYRFVALSVYTRTTKAKFFRLFFDHVNRDSASFGTFQQPYENPCLVQYVRDMFVALDSIVSQYPVGVLSYANWYISKFEDRQPTNYGELVTLDLCHNLMMSTFEPENIRFGLVEFVSPQN